MHRFERALAAALLAVVLGWMLAPSLQAQQAAPPDEEKLVASRALLDATGFAKQFDVVVPRMSQQLAQIFIKQKPDNAAEITDVFGKLVERFAQRKQELYEKLAVLYARRLPLEDMRELTRFYTSPVGTRFITMMPELTAEAMQIGQVWGEGIGRELGEAAQRELKKRGIDL